MMNARKIAGAALLFAGLAGLAAPVQAEVALGAKVGTLGAGAELTAGLSRRVNFRLGANAFSYTDEGREVSDIEYDAEANLRNATALLDFHPGGRAFRLTGGLVWNGNNLEGRSLPPASGVYDIGGVPVPVTMVGTLNAEVEFDPVVPYAGIGWGNAVGDGKRVGFFFDLGAFFQGEADATLTPVIPEGSLILTTPGARELLQVLIEREEREFEEDAADYDIYPVVSFGVSYRF